MCSIRLISLFCAFGIVSCNHYTSALYRHASEAMESQAPPQVNKSKKVQIDMYYESMCPYCRRFFSTALKPMLEDKELMERIDLYLYPFGNAKLVPMENVSKDYKFWHPADIVQGYEHLVSCQHGKDECFGNKIQACALKLNERAKANSFITCMESSNYGSLELSSYMCQSNHTIDLDQIRKCVHSKDGYTALTEIGLHTQNLSKPAGPHEYVPWVVINGHHDKEAELDGDEGYSGFLFRQVCAQLTSPQPKSCSSIETQTPEEMKQIESQRLQALNSRTPFRKYF